MSQITCLQPRLSVDALPYLPQSLRPLLLVKSYGNGNQGANNNSICPPPIKISNIQSPVNESNLSIYERLDTIPFTPGMGVCTPSPRNSAIKNRLSPFEEGSPKNFVENKASQFLSINMEKEKRASQSPSSPFGCSSHNTNISSNYSLSSDTSQTIAGSPDIATIEDYHQLYHRYLYSNCYTYDASSWTNFPPEQNGIYAYQQWNTGYPPCSRMTMTSSLTAAAAAAAAAAGPLDSIQHQHLQNHHHLSQTLTSTTNNTNTTSNANTNTNININMIKDNFFIYPINHTTTNTTTMNTTTTTTTMNTSTNTAPNSRCINDIHIIFPDYRDMDQNKNILFNNNTISNKSVDKKLKVKNAQQCPDVSASGELKLNARQRRTFRRAKDRLMQLFDRINMELVRKNLEA